MKYLDFDLLLERTEERYKVRVLSSPAGQASIDFSLPFSNVELENFLLKVGRTRRGVRCVDSPEMAAAKAFGRSLFKAVFTDEVWGCLHSSLDEAVRQSYGLRLRLHLTSVPELADIPWEFLYNPSLDRFLALSIETPLVRYLDLPERLQTLEVKSPLRVLVMISSPYNHPKLDVEQEWAKLKHALVDLERHGVVELERLDEATLTAMQRRLRQKQFHIFHFIGHGYFDKQAQDGMLILEEDENKMGRPVSGRYLGTLMHDERTLRLAFLNACEGARTSCTDPFAGAAQSLVQQGIPAVIAMQFEVTDKTAITLAREFYAALADGYPVDAALAEARKAIFAQGNDVEWGTPVLYMRAPDGRIFDIKHTKDASSAEQAPSREIWPPAVKSLGPIDLNRLARKLSSPERSPGENPYLNRVMIRDPGDFWGRKSEIQRIYARIGSASRPQSISIVGERRIGKSSLLHYLYHPENRRKYLTNPEHYTFAFIDFQEESITSLKEFFETIYHALMQEYLGEFKISLRPDYNGFKSLVRSLDAQGTRLIILFDEFALVTSNPIFGPEFFAFFRSMANKYNIAYVVATAKELQSLCHSKEIATSPFFNIFSNLYLGAFKIEEAVELICGPSSFASHSLEPHRDDILNLAGLVPLYLQIACSVFFELVKNGRQRDSAMLYEAKRQFLEEAGVHFKNTWEKFTPDEQALVANIIAGKKSRESESYLVNKLVKESYLVEKNNHYTLLSPAFEEYVRDHLGGNTVWKKMLSWRRKNARDS